MSKIPKKFQSLTRRQTELEICPPGMLHSAGDLWLVTDVLGQRIRATFKNVAFFSDCLTFEDWTDRLPQMLVTDYQPALLNVPEEQDLTPQRKPEIKLILLQSVAGN